MHFWVVVMDENSAKKIVRFYLDITEKSEDEVKKLLIGSGKAIRYFNLKSGDVIKKSMKTIWNALIL